MAAAGDTGNDMEKLRDRIKGDFYYEGAGVEALKKWRAMSEEERAAQRRGDELDDIDTSDLEKVQSSETEQEWGEDYEFDDSLQHLEENRINLARAFLGYKGGYSIRKLKKFYKQSMLGRLNEEGEVEEGHETEGEEAAVSEGEQEDITEGEEAEGEAGAEG